MASARKRREYLRAQGRAGMIDNLKAHKRVKYLHEEKNLSLRQIARKSGVSQSAVRAIYLRNNTKCWVVNESRILGTRFDVDDVTWVPFIGTYRRIGALAAAGFSQAWVVEQIGADLVDQQILNRRMLRKPEKVDARFAKRVKEVYDKWSCTDPADVTPPRRRSYSLTVARKHGYAPPVCWDDDTIDDPDAFPEWTGQCGTAYGYALHHEHGIFLDGNGSVRCVPCREAKRDASAAYRVRKARVLELHNEGWTTAAIAEDVGATERTVQRIVRRHVAK